MSFDAETTAHKKLELCDSGFCRSEMVAFVRVIHFEAMKRFLEWIDLKEKLDVRIHRPPFVSEGDVWWASVGENVGSEVNGKSNQFSRPVIILKKLAHGFYFVVPTTTKIRIGSWYVSFRQKERPMAACLHQARALDYRRLSSKLGTLDDQDLTNVRNGFSALYTK